MNSIESVFLFLQGTWLFFAYLLEFQGLDTFLPLWLASLLFFIVNAFILINLVSSIKVRHCRVEYGGDRKIE